MFILLVTAPDWIAMNVRFLMMIVSVLFSFLVYHAVHLILMKFSTCQMTTAYCMLVSVSLY